MTKFFSDLKNYTHSQYGKHKKITKTTQKLFKNTYVFSPTVSSEKYSEKHI